ncbi:hypothetical protein Pint_23070 [Pistacia integerrima]|uniref:Uncharacterized protein n=1 Tax=Pistacia integerrima TaxID=434235 RepID=A0ACC0YKJ7_9ROSI|nr:hypothetical protein Pint_23070 [Pistacia integerrima]
MGSTSTISLYSNPKSSLRSHPFPNTTASFYHSHNAPRPNTVPFNGRKRCFRFRRLVVAVASGAEGGPRRSTTGRRVYRQSQSESALTSAPVKQIASFVVPAVVFVAGTFVLWKLVEKILMPKPQRPSSGENKPPAEAAEGIKWSVAPGTNLLSGFTAKLFRESKQTLNEFAKELRSFRSVDMSGRNFGDEGLFFLAESLGYNQTAEEVSFAANGITAAGIKAFDGVLQSNIALHTLNLSGNPIGDEGVKDSMHADRVVPFFECLCDILVNNSGIQKLQLNSIDLGDEGTKAIAELLKQNSSLRHLELNNNMIEYSGFTGLAEALLENNTLRSLHLNGNYGGALGANALAKGLEGNKSLRELHLHGNSIGDEGVRALMSGLSSHKGKIAVLDLGNNSISAKGAFHVAEYIKNSKSVLWLNLYMNDIGDEV